MLRKRLKNLTRLYSILQVRGPTLFDKIDNEFKELGTIFDAEHLGSRFLSKLEDNYMTPEVQYFNFTTTCDQNRRNDGRTII